MLGGCESTQVLNRRFVPKKWRGVRGIHVKGPETAALPIWLADELWADEGDVLNEEEAKTIEEKKATVGKKRKSLADVLPEESKESRKKQKKLPKSNDDTLDQEIALRRQKLKEAKAAAAKDVEDDVPKPTKKGKKGKVVAT